MKDRFRTWRDRRLMHRRTWLERFANLSYVTFTAMLILCSFAASLAGSAVAASRGVTGVGYVLGPPVVVAGALFGMLFAADKAARVTRARRSYLRRMLDVDDYTNGRI